MLDAVLFDLDGTLTDPEIGIVASYRHALAAVGHPVADDVDLRWMIGPAIRDNLTTHGVPDHLHEAAVLAYRSRHVEVGLFEADLVPGIVEVLDGLTADGVRLATATAKPYEQAVTTLEHFGIADRFEVVGAGVADGRPRPKAVIVADALDQLGHPEPGRVAMVGDRLHDIEGARVNGCIAVGVRWGFAVGDELVEHGADHLVDRPAELLELLRSLG